MKKLVPIVIALLLVSFIANASNQIDLNSMTQTELEALRNEITQTIEKNHKVSPSEREKIRNSTKNATEEHFAKQGINVSWAWINYEYTKEWYFYTLKTHINYKDKSGNNQKQDVYSEIYETDNDFQPVYIKIGNDVIIDNRALVPDDHRIKLAALTDSTAKLQDTEIPIISTTPAPIVDTSAYRTLKVGSKGEDVLAVRVRMYELGFFSKVPTQTEFTANMKKYVIDFQKANNLKADGVLTPEVQEVLFSDSAKPKPTPLAKLSKPKNLKAAIVFGKISLCWDAVPGATSYNVFRATSKSGQYTHIATVKALNYTDSKLTRGKTYFYKVEAFADNNKSDQTNAVKAAVPTLPPTPVPEPKYPLVNTGKGDAGTSYGYKWFKNNYKNTSTKYTVDGYTIAYYATDVYGDRIKAHGFGDYISYEIVNQTIKPGKTGNAPKITAYGYDHAKRIHAAISKIHFTNGVTIEIPEKDREYWYWEY
ncbi:MAG: peptidoglycan-binding protein [Christensenellales bacterium]|jgi:peptidoglycan hydrolase-like protein with peptidoglycan-binding domain